MRRRVAAVIDALPDVCRSDLHAKAQEELGIDLPWRAWPKFCANCDLRDLLDLVTITYTVIQLWENRVIPYGGSTEFVKKIARLFSEEGVCYRVDEYGGVHFQTDKEFSTNKAATVAVLGTARYANVLNSFEQAFQAFSIVPPDGKSAIRLTFAAIEGFLD
jgi:hypothetical protein